MRSRLATCTKRARTAVTRWGQRSLRDAAFEQRSELANNSVAVPCLLRPETERPLASRLPATQRWSSA